MVYPLDDFELILGNEFFLVAKMAVMPYLGGILIANEKQPCFVPRNVKDKRIKEGTSCWISAIQVQKGLKKGKRLTLLHWLRLSQMCKLKSRMRWLVADALSRMKVQEYVVVITRVESDFADRIRENAKTDAEYQRTSATGLSPFELAMGQQPLTPHKVARTCTGCRCPAAYRFARAKQELLEEAKDSLSKAAKRMNKYADQWRRSLEFQVGDKDLVNLGRKQAKRAPPVIQKQFDCGVERILDHKTKGQSKKNRRTSYLVKWENSPEWEA
ncbi:hypothetical protein Vadar_022023 [Vaccinium darrowii]|uniref:Uncharacterized protein n=1 Tax=Vaccinium darrowii TaxID=229202 RepID=A0ACB7XC35_9ERIC|nr:hypothetical protein Vadar_022023 [Vaccinium darrowii]